MLAMLVGITGLAAGRRAEGLGRLPRPGPHSSYAASSLPTSRFFGHGPKRQGRVLVTVAAECDEAGRDHHGFVDRRLVAVLEVAQQGSFPRRRSSGGGSSPPPSVHLAGDVADV